MNHLALVLLALCTLIMMGSAIGLIWSGMRAKRRAVQDRIATVLPRDQAPAISLISISTDAPAPTNSPLQQVANFFGVRGPLPASYPLPWWLVVVAAFVLARVSAMLTGAIVGEWALLQIPFVAYFISNKIFGFWDKRRQTALLKQLPDALSLIVRAVRVGQPVSEALRGVASRCQDPISTEFSRVASEMTVGTELETALRDLATRSGVPEFRFFATALGLQARTGGGLAETLDNLADLIRKRLSVRARGYALASEARTSTLVLTALPFITAIAMMLVSPAYMMPMFIEPFGHKMLMIAAMMLIGGTVVMRTMISKALS